MGAESETEQESEGEEERSRRHKFGQSEKSAQDGLNEDSVDEEPSVAVLESKGACAEAESKRRDAGN